MTSEEIQAHLLLEGIYMKYGFDFRGYAKASLSRRLYSSLRTFECQDLLELLRKVLESEEAMKRLLENLTISTTEMFRNPEVFKVIREDMVPLLRTYPSLKFWVAGCSTGEEVYALSILLHEEGLGDRSLIYATDINTTSLAAAKAGTYRLEDIKNHTRNYQLAGGLQSFSNYYRASADVAVMDEKLKKNVVFAEHNLVSDGTFAEMNLIMCRNVMIYFANELKERVLRLFLSSLCTKGFLCLGHRETARFTSISEMLSSFNESARIYQKNALSMSSSVW